MSWRKEVEGIEQRRRLAAELGGKEAVAKQHDLGRLTIRERIDGLLDASSFEEQGPIAGYSELGEDGEVGSFTPANYVMGLGRIEDRPVVVGGEDFTLRGGSPTPAGLRKSVFAETLAVRFRLPLVRFLQGGGGSVMGASGRGRQPAAAPSQSEHRFRSIAQAMATAPGVSAAAGDGAGSSRGRAPNGGSGSRRIRSPPVRGGRRTILRPQESAIWRLCQLTSHAPPLGP